MSRLHSICRILDREDDGAADCAHQHDRDFLSDQEGSIRCAERIRHGGAGRQRCQSRVLLFCQIATPIFVLRPLHPDLYEAVRGLVTVVNLTQVLGMFSALFILVLTFTDEKWQPILQSGASDSDDSSGALSDGTVRIMGFPVRYWRQMLCGVCRDRPGICKIV